MSRSIVPAGVHGFVSQDGWLGVAFDGETYVLAKAEREVDPVEWTRIVVEEWNKPDDGGLIRAVQRAHDLWGPVGLLREAKKVELGPHNLVVLDGTASET